MKQVKISIIEAMVFSLILACSGGEMSDKNVSYDELAEVPDAIWEKLATKKIYFGHQSVGNDIIGGIKSLMNDIPSIKLNIQDIADKVDFEKGILAHSSIGRNTKPQTKVDAFIEEINNGIGENADAAAMKFCYIDIRADTDIAKVFDGYKQGIETVKKRYPSLKIIHMTVPLIQIQSGPKAWIKKLLGKPLGGVNDNIKRLEYNDLLERSFGGTDPIFDISEAESTYPDGKKEIFKKDGKMYYALVPAYTYDGGHLNDTGKRVVAEKFLLFLINSL